MKSVRARLLALFAAIAVVSAGILVPIAATAAVPYPAQAPGRIMIEAPYTTSVVSRTYDFPAGTTFGPIQWFRGTKAVGGNSDQYDLTEADNGHLLKVRYTVTVPGFAPTQRTSATQNVTMARSGQLAITGSPQVGATLSYTDTTTFTNSWPWSVFPFRSYSWRVDGVEVASFSDPPQTLTVLPAYFGKTITLVGGAVDGNGGSAPQYFSSAPLKITKHPVIPHSAASVAVTKTVNGNGSITLSAAATATITEPGVTGPTYQWYRADQVFGTKLTPITGKTASTYTLTAADYPYRIFVRATWKKANFDPLVVDSFKKDYSVRAENRRVLGSLVVGGGANGVNDFSFELEGDTDDRDYVPSHGTVVYAWYRAGKLVSGQTDYVYPVTTSDLGKTLHYTVTVSKAGYLTGTNLKSSTSAKIGAGALDYSTLGSPVFTVNPTTMKVTVAPTGATTPSSTVSKVQWRRDGVVVFTGAAYQLTAADYGTTIDALMTYSRPGYASGGPATSQSFKPWVKPSIAHPRITGDQVIGEWVDLEPRTFVNADTNAPISTVGMTYQWYRNGVVIPAGEGGQFESYQLQEKDRGKSITVKVTMPSTGLLPSIVTSAPIGPIGDAELDGHHNAPTVAVSGSTTAPVLTATTGVTGPAGYTVKYQWYRGDAAISGATKQTYTLTSADRGKQVRVRVTTSRTGGYTSSVKDSARTDYSLSVSGAQLGPSGVDPTPGTAIEVLSTVSTADGPTSGYTTRTEWLRNGKLIAGSLNVSPYVLSVADVGAKITARVTYSKPGHLPVTTTTPAIVVLKGQLAAIGVTPTIQQNGFGKLKVVVAGITPAPTSYAYQWLRNGTAISKATASTYTLTTADAGKAITVRVTAIKAGYASVVLPVSAAWDPDIDAAGPLVLAAGPHKVGESISAVPPAYSTAGGGVATPFIAYRWLRNGAVVAGQTTNTYTLGAADLNASIQAQAIVTLEGHLPLTQTSAGTFPTAQGTTTTNPTPVVTFNDAAQTLTASITGMQPATPAPALSYQWMRDAAPIANAKSATYNPIAADVTADLWVKITVNRGASFDNTIPVLESDPTNYRIVRGSGVAPEPLTIDGTLRVGETLNVPTFGYNDGDGNGVLADEVYTWMRNGVAIAGQTASAYTLTPADLGKRITVKVRATSPGKLTYSSPATAPSAIVTAGEIEGSFSIAFTSPSAGTFKADLVPGVGATPGAVAVGYQWYRNGTKITGATKQTYKLVTADLTEPIYVKISVGRTAYVTKPELVSDLANYLNAQPGTPDIIDAGSSLHVDSSTVPVFLGPGVTTSSQYTLRYMWFRNGTPVSDWSPNTGYVLLPGDSGATFQAHVQAYKPGYWSDFTPSTSFVVP